MRNRKSEAFLFLFVLVLMLAFSFLAYAQVPTPAPPVPVPPAAVVALTPATIIISLLGVLAGFVAQAINTGSLFGIATLPKTWLPYLTTFGVFLAALVTSISMAPVQNSVAWFNALLAGLTALFATTAGVTVHQHMNAQLSPPTQPATVPPSKAG